MGVGGAVVGCCWGGGKWGLGRDDQKSGGGQRCIVGVVGWLSVVICWSDKLRMSLRCSLSLASLRRASCFVVACREMMLHPWFVLHLSGARGGSLALAKVRPPCRLCLGCQSRLPVANRTTVPQAVTKRPCAMTGPNCLSLSYCPQPVPVPHSLFLSPKHDHARPRPQSHQWRPAEAQAMENALLRGMGALEEARSRAMEAEAAAGHGGTLGGGAEGVRSPGLGDSLRAGNGAVLGKAASKRLHKRGPSRDVGMTTTSGPWGMASTAPLSTIDSSGVLGAGAGGGTPAPANPFRDMEVREWGGGGGEG